MVHYGQTGPVLQRRQQLWIALTNNTRSVVKGPRQIAGPPDKVWINPPAEAKKVA